MCTYQNHADSVIANRSRIEGELKEECKSEFHSDSARIDNVQYCIILMWYVIEDDSFKFYIWWKFLEKAVYFSGSNSFSKTHTSYKASLDRRLDSSRTAQKNC